MMMKISRAAAVVLLCVMISAVFALPAAEAAKKRRYSKNTMPAGWKYEAGFFIWRTNNGLAATPATWKKYMREKGRMESRNRTQTLDHFVLNGVDWTIEELAAYLERQRRLAGE